MKRPKQREAGLLNVIHDNKLENLLSNLEILKPIQDGNIKCKFCKEVVSIDVINGIFPESNVVKISCNRTQCVLELSEYLNEKDV